jgi:hypothetical protein
MLPTTHALMNYKTTMPCIFETPCIYIYIWMFPTVHALMTTIIMFEWFATHITHIWTLPTVYALMSQQNTTVWIICYIHHIYMDAPHCVCVVVSKEQYSVRMICYIQSFDFSFYLRCLHLRSQNQTLCSISCRKKCLPSVSANKK